MAYLVILNDLEDVGDKVMAVAQFEGSTEACEILADWAEMCIEQVAYLETPFAEYDLEKMIDYLSELNVSVEIVEGM
jgi:hypothetical protein